jgi:undecaprenyl-diphosphatase
MSRILIGSNPMTRSREPVRDRVRTILEHQLATVDSPDRARATVQKVLKAAGDASEADRSHENGRQPGSAADQLGRVARGRSRSDRVAAVLVETATQSLASREEAQGVAEAAYDVLGSGTHRISAAAERGRSLLRAASLDGMRRADSLEGRAFLAVSGLPHPAWLHALCEGLGGVAMGGWIWVGGALVAYLLKIDRSDQALKLVTPIMAIVAFTAERPAKAIFIRRRPFGHLLGIMLLGGKPRRRSFPSGHAATSFAGAWTLGSVWPQRRPMLLGLAALVSVSRVYLGAHDPGEILAGGVLGMVLAETLRRPAGRLLEHLDLP